MYKKCVCLISLVFLLGMVGNVSAADRNWTNANGNRLWSTAANWSGSVIPTSADKAAIRNSAISGPIIQSGITAVANQIVVGDWSSTNDTITMTGGSLTTSGTSCWVILGYGAANKGTFTVSGGTATFGDNFYVGFGGKGYLQMTGGTITVGLVFGIAQNTGSIADVNLYGGTINANGTFNMTSGGGLDITTGTLIVNGDVTTLINTYITNGWITAYGGTGTVNVSYNTPNVGKTTVTASSGSPPGQATTPNPANAATGIGITNDLSWAAGSGATSHNVYFGTTSPGTLRGNQTATTYDTGTMVNTTTYYWRIDEQNANGTTTGVVWSFTTVVAPPGQAATPNPATGATGIGITNDLSWAAGSGATSHNVYFGTTSPGTSQGNQTATTFDTGTMAYSTTYYWRIDEQNANGTTTGVVWSFTTVVAPPGQAASPSPANGATGIGITNDLSWAAGSGATSHNVYFGTTSPGTSRGNQTATTYDTGTMVNSTTYYWRIDEQNAGGTTTGVVWSFTTAAAPPPGQAANPNPANGATGVGTTNDLSWSAGSGATSHDVYFGTTSPGTLRGNQTATTYDTGTMANSTTYYWRIDEKNANGTTQGVVWSFTTAAVSPPGKATTPNPANGASGVGTTNDLSWSAGSGATSHDVYFGTTSPGTLRGNQTATTYDTGTMTNSTTYYWRINEKNASGTTTGDVWSFTTVAPGAGVDRNWTNDSNDRLWRTAANWSGGAVPTSVDKAAIRNDAISGPIIDASTSADANQIVVGDWSSTNDTINMTGGSLTVNQWVILAYDINNSGTFTVSAGTVNVSGDLFVGFGGAGTINITGGTITVIGTLGIAQLTGSTGHVYLDGGTITTGALNMATGATIDIGAGTLILDGDVTATINGYIGNGWIIAYSGSGAVNVDYNVTNPLKTTLTGSMPTSPPTKATNPNPPNSATGVSILPTLTCSAGSGAASHDVYFGTASPGTFRGNQAGVTYNPGVLNSNTVYYWRIDEKNVVGTTTGDVWSFRTIADSNYTLLGKVMCGYQGWFNCPSDGTSRGWIHWSTSTSSFTPSTLKVDLWPDTDDLATGEKFLASSFNDGKNRYVFSSHNHDTVLRHFQWMQTYGIDGVFLQRFAIELTPGSAPFNHRNDVLAYCKEGANLYGRKYAVMYDLSGLGSGQTQKVIDDWKYLVDNGKVSKNPSYDPAYIFYKGKPVVAVYGVAYSGRAYSHQEVRNLIDFLKNDPTYGGNTVLIGCYQNWRTVTDTYVQQTFQLADIILPWLVGAYSNTSGVNNWASSKGVPDKNWCVSNGKDYMPVMFPGFSWHNMYPGDPLNQIPRVGGQFLWDQVKADFSTVGANMFYVAMFDEVDEGTAIFKVTNDPPKPGGATLFVTYEGLPSDEYLWLVGQAGRGLRGEIPVNQTRPARGSTGVDRDWTNGNGNRLWSTAANWSGGVVPTNLDKAAIRNSAISGPIINAGTTAVANQIVVGDWSSTNDTIDMTGGTLTTNDWFTLGYGATNRGTFTVSAGTANIGSTLYVGNSGIGTLTITGGAITVTGTFGIAQLTGSTGDVFLDGGTITCGSFNMTSGGAMDITAGTLIVNGDVTSTINGYISSNWITAYGGAGTVNVSYNTPNAGKTTVTATSGGATPTFVAAGAVSSGTGAITPALPAGIATNDILLLFLETANEAISISNQNGGTWTAVTNSPQGTGTAGGTSATRLTAFWSRYNGTQGAPTASDSGNHQLGRIIAIRGAAASGNPWDVTAGGVEATADTSGSIPGATTTVANTLVVTAIATSLPDASGTANFSSWTNGNLTSVTERTDNTVTAGNGGGLGVATGIKATAGAYGNTAVTLATSASKGMMSIAIKP
jgi:T5SS/PEP-CTERM-associated repeat protein